jgi:hypothetical protein
MTTFTITPGPKLAGRTITETATPCPACLQVGHTTAGGQTPPLKMVAGDPTPFCLGHGYITFTEATDD